MNHIQVAGMVRNISFSHEIKGVKMYEGTIAVERKSGIVDILIFQTWQDDIHPLEYYSIDGELRTIRTDSYPKKKTYIKAIGIKHLMQPIEHNEVNLIGTIEDKTPVRYTPLGRTINDFILKVKTEHSTAYISTIAWGIIAKRLENVPNGTNIRIEGRLQKRYFKRADSDKLFGLHEVSIQKLYLEGDNGYLQIKNI